MTPWTRISRRSSELLDRPGRPGGRPRPSRRRELRVRRRIRARPRRGAARRACSSRRGARPARRTACPDPTFGGIREAELIAAAKSIGLDEVSILDGYPDGGVADEPFDRLVAEIAAWLADRRPQAVITFGPHGVTGHPDHVAVGSATRWAVEKLAEVGDRAQRGLRHRSRSSTPGARSTTSRRRSRRPPIGSRSRRGRAAKLAALEAHASQADTAEAIAALRAAIEAGRADLRGVPSRPAPGPIAASGLDTALL